MADKVDSNDYIVDGTTKDLKSSSKKTLADYLSSRTLGGAETYVQPGHDGTYTYKPPRQNDYTIDSASSPTSIGSSAAYHSPSETTQKAFSTDLTAHQGNPVLTALIELDPSARTGTSSGAANGHEILASVADSTTTANSEVYNDSTGIFSENENTPSSVYGSAVSSSPYDSYTAKAGLGDGFTGNNSVDYRDPATINKVGDYVAQRTLATNPINIVDSAQAGGLYHNNTTEANAYPVSFGSVETSADAEHHSPAESTQAVFANADELSRSQGNPVVAGLVSVEPSTRTVNSDARDGHSVLSNVADIGSNAHSKLYNTDDGIYSLNNNSPEQEYGSNESGSPYDSVKDMSGLGDGYTGAPGVIGRNGVNLKSNDTIKKLGDYLSDRTRAVDPEPVVDSTQADGLYRNNSTRSNTYPISAGSSYPTRLGADVKLQGNYASDQEMSRGRSYEPGLRKTVKVVPSADRSTTVDAPNGNDVLNSEPLVKPAVNGILMSNRFNAESKFTAKKYSSAMPRSPTGKIPTDSDGNVFEKMAARTDKIITDAAGGVGGLLSLDGAGGTSKSLPYMLFPFLGNPNAQITGLTSGELSEGGNKREKYVAPGGGLDGLNNPEVADIGGLLFDTNEEQDLSNAEPAKYNNRSFGQLNSYLQQFSGTGTLSSITLALLAYASLFIGVAVLSLLISLVINRLPRPDADTGKLPLGAERGANFGQFLFDADSGSGGLDVLRVIGSLVAKVMGLMQPYESPFESLAGDFFAYFFSALEGAVSIIGINTDAFSAGSIGTALVSSAANLLINFGTAPSYYLILVREVARDLHYLGDKISSRAGSSILGILQGFGDMKITRYVDTCARLGIVNSYAKNNTNGSIYPDESITVSGQYVEGAPIDAPISLTTNYFDVGQDRVSRSREVKGSRRLSWSHMSIGYTRSELVTEQLLRASANMPVQKTPNSTPTGGLRRLKARKVFSSTGRISKEERERHEKILDAEYMPFYFHDLRTNEILSFHAFLSALSDSYSSNYNTVDGFGRMDPIQIYKNTTRAISFTFTVVATSPEDHENMWHSINKLVNMVYPQWSEGETLSGTVTRGISAGTQTFTQPFSQTIASSPMLRVRIGDVIHSNYSKFALSRIFGLDKSDSSLVTSLGGTASLQNPTPGVDTDISSISKETAGDLAGTPAAEAKVAIGIFGTEPDYNLNKPQTPGMGNDIISTVFGTIQVLLNPVTVTVNPKRYKLYKNIDDAYFRKHGNSERLKLALPAKVKAYSLKEKNSSKDPTSFVIVELDSPIRIESGFVQESYSYIVCDSKDLTITADGVDENSSLLSLFGPSTPPADATQSLVSSFMSSQNNPIVRSFEEGSGGRGLAGFITQLGLEYGSTDITWTVEKGSRAPNMVSIQVSFSPIHDIPMGLASDGTARAVAYPVGNITRQRFFPERVYQDLVDDGVIVATSMARKKPTKDDAGS